MGADRMHNGSLVAERTKQHGARALRILDAYWHSLAARGGVPRRAAIDPGAIQDALEYAFLVDRVGPHHARVRITGGAVNGILGADLVGMPLSVFLTPEARVEFDDVLARCFDQSAMLSLTLVKTDAVAQMHLYPLLDHKGRIAHLLGGIVAEGGAASGARRFDLAETQEHPVNCGPVAPHRNSGGLRLVIDKT